MRREWICDTNSWLVCTNEEISAIVEELEEELAGDSGEASRVRGVRDTTTITT